MFFIQAETPEQLPQFAHDGDAGMDLKALEDVTIEAHGRKLVHTGVKIAIPSNCVAFVMSRSGLALKQGLFVLNAPGVVDSNYRGDIGVIMCNTTDTDYEIKVGDRVAQLIIQEFITPEWHVVGEIPASSARGDKGFGSTGN